MGLWQKMAVEYSGPDRRRRPHELMGLREKAKRRMGPPMMRLLVTADRMTEEASVKIADEIMSALRGPGG